MRTGDGTSAKGASQSIGSAQATAINQVNRVNRVNRVNQQVDQVRREGQRHSDVVPKPAGHAAARALPPLRLPDETRAVWMQAYESSFDSAFEKLESGDALIPFVYAAGENDERFARGMLAFAYELSLRLSEADAACDADAAFAMLEVAESTLSGAINKDLCVHIAENLIAESYARFEADRRFDSYFLCHCAAAVARLVARVDQPASAADATEAVLSGVAALRAPGKSDLDAACEVRKLAARCIRRALHEAEPNGSGPIPGRA